MGMCPKLPVFFSILATLVAQAHADQACEALKPKLLIKMALNIKTGQDAKQQVQNPF